MTRARTRTWSDPLPTVGATKRLVAHRPRQDEDPFDAECGPSDGQPVGVPAPCHRLVAGYWCSCGDVSRARVEPAADDEWDPFFDTTGGCTGSGERWPTDRERLDLQAQIEALPVGTVVERFGTGIAPGFEAPARYPSWVDEPDPMPF